ncbi:uncharacterized protein LOC143607858 [Bidens hawaiensis]|uniref:uncharacterized protein LOC143607858 n=1 Tax=Bidens hawaiensis TaxID=980011 RepID=UPI00404928A6
MNAKKARKDSSVVTGMFLINNHYAFILFDIGAYLSFVSEKFETSLANGKLIETREIIHGCNILLENHRFSISLFLVELGNFDVVVGMDWLSKNHAEIVCSEKLVCLPLTNGETLAILSDRSSSDLKLTSIAKTHKMLHKGYPAFLVNVVDTKAKERKIEGIPVVRDFPEVFPEDLPRLPPPASS